MSNKVLLEKEFVGLICASIAFAVIDGILVVLVIPDLVKGLHSDFWTGLILILLIVFVLFAGIYGLLQGWVASVTEEGITCLSSFQVRHVSWSEMKSVQNAPNFHARIELHSGRPLSIPLAAFKRWKDFPGFVSGLILTVNTEDGRPS